MIVELLTECHLEFLSLKGGCIGLSESTLVKMSNVGNLMPRLNSYYPGKDGEESLLVTLTYKGP